MSSSAFNAALAAQLGELDKVAPRKAGGKFPARPKFHFKPGPDVKHAKAGIYTWKIKNAKGSTIPKTSQKLRGVVVDYGFRFQDFGETPAGKWETHCATTSHIELNSEGEKVKGDGWWKLPAYDHETIFKMFNPTGMKMDPELVDDESRPIPLTCQRCHELGLNLEKPGEPRSESNKARCKDDGYVVVSVISRVDPETEEWVAIDPPELMTLAWGRMSNDTFTRYLRKLMIENRQNVEDVITEFSISVPDKRGNYKPEMIAEYPEDVAILTTAKNVYTEARAAWQADRDEYIAKMKAEREANGGSDTKASATVTDIADKRGAKSVGGVKTKALPVTSDGDEDNTDDMAF